MPFAFWSASLGACAFPPDVNGHVTIPGGTTAIAANAFKDCNVANESPYLQTLSLPASLQTIGQSAFENCDGLLSLDLSGTGVDSIGVDAFRGCTILSILTSSCICLSPSSGP